jgi:hypothetical protein
MKLLRVVPSANAEKKYDAVFQQDSGRTKTTSFGAKGYTDFLQSADKDRRERYLTRHRANENWNNPVTAGSLSKHLLWGPSTSLQENIATFKNKFSL